MKSLAWIVGAVVALGLLGGEDILMELLLEMLFVVLIFIPAILVIMDARVIFKKEEKQ